MGIVRILDSEHSSAILSLSKLFSEMYLLTSAGFQMGGHSLLLRMSEYLSIWIDVSLWHLQRGFFTHFKRISFLLHNCFGKWKSLAL